MKVLTVLVQLKCAPDVGVRPWCVDPRRETMTPGTDMLSFVRVLSRALVRALIVVLAVAAVGIAVLVIADWRARRTGEVRIVELPFMKPGSDAIATGRIIFVQSDKADEADLLAHELVHVCQWEEQGISFLWGYTSEYTKNLAEYGDLDTAYIELSFEKQARLGDIDCDLSHYLARQP